LSFSIYSRGCEKGSDHFENICVAPRGVVESWCVDQNDTTTVEIKSTRDLHGVCAGPQTPTNAKVCSADEIDKLCKSRSGQGKIRDEIPRQYTAAGPESRDGGERERTVDLPLPVAPITLSEPNGLTDRPGSMRSKGFVWGRGT
jgi:hypothetical protein